MKIYCVVIHGVENRDISDGFADSFISGIHSCLKTTGNVFFSPYNWSRLVHDRQMHAYNCLEGGLSKKTFRKLKNTIGSDIMWYSRSKNTTDGMDIYDQIHLKLERTIDDMILMYGHEDFRVVLIGHSYGTQIALNHCFESKHKIVGLVTMGSPIGSISGCFPDWGHLPNGLEFWMNFWSDKDFVSSPLQNHPSEQIANFVKDFRVESWNPMVLLTLGAHTQYWNHGNTHKKIANKLDSFLK